MRYSTIIALLFLIYKSPAQTPLPAGNIDSNTKSNKPKFGVVIGSRITKLDPVFNEAGTPNITAVTSESLWGFDLGFTSRFQVTNIFSLRPNLLLLFDGSELYFTKKNINPQSTVEKIKVEIASLSLTIPATFNINDKKISPYFSLAPGYSYFIGTDEEVDKILPLKKSLFFAEAGLGLDIKLKAPDQELSVELRYSHGLNNLNKEIQTDYSLAISSLKRQSFGLSLYLRAKKMRK